MIMASFWRYLAAAQGPFLATIMKLGKPKAFPYVAGAPLTTPVPRFNHDPGGPELTGRRW